MEDFIYRNRYFITHKYNPYKVARSHINLNKAILNYLHTQSLLTELLIDIIITFINYLM